MSTDHTPATDAGTDTTGRVPGRGADDRENGEHIDRTAEPINPTERSRA